MPARFTDDGRIIRDHEIDPDDYHYPTNRSMCQNLIGRMLTHIDALGLPSGQEKATKDLVRQSIQQWWIDVCDNSLTSYRGCLGPIEVHRAPNGTERDYVWVALTAGVARVEVASESAS